ncbi:MAG: hypothetical protein IJD04_03170 [Desulfovibrionaceae bacterium]|nr:hypothetical protein [Desulfovibrionaceae bacterium]
MKNILTGVTIRNRTMELSKGEAGAAETDLKQKMPMRRFLPLSVFNIRLEELTGAGEQRRVLSGF